ncbi:DnaD domain protein [uncultured Traorella sp.]|jgi:DNA replication protein|uniref:DnaD domain-containing protein n=1 Tax=uncultured Traorella sp. TaxID=1929048 RepID=UPI0025D06ECE|nr:DnaD domain protein [uncultured Traorella sp.]
MKQWYEKKYFNRMYWIFEEMENLNLTHTQLCLILLVQYLNETHSLISFDVLKNKLNKSEEEIDDLLDQLHQKGYLQIDVTPQGFDINIDGLFQMENELHFEKNIFDLFESEFKRPLSPYELQRISDWLNTYDERSITFALRDASMRNILNFDYINRILENGAHEEDKQ